MEHLLQDFNGVDALGSPEKTVQFTGVRAGVEAER